ncbi:MAG: MATE family efflux transporter [Bacteriovoracaceae bacterium]|nr:MATE family efflux transporter [Bacteriovoracaceae bacterium]
MLEKFKELLKFTGPIVAGKIGLMLIGAGDVWVASHHSPEALAAIGIANGLSLSIMLLASGMNVGLSPLLSKIRGEGHDSTIHLKTCCYFSVIYAAPAVVIVYAMHWLVPSLGFDPKLVNDIQQYLIIIAPSILFVGLFEGLKEFLQSDNKVYLTNLFSIMAIFLNVALNKVFLYGFGPIPAYGVQGLAMASFFVRLFLALSVVTLVIKYKPWEQKFSWDFFKTATRFCFPISLSFFFEVLAFASMAPLIGRMGTEQAAAHNVVITVASTSFMFPLSVASALATKIGFCYGERNYRDIVTFAKIGMFISQGLAIVSGIIYLCFPELILSFFGLSGNVAVLATRIIFITAVFQFFDNAQVTLAGILRGIGISKPVMVANIIGYWIIGLPIGLYIAYEFNLGAIGLWWSIALSLFLVSTSIGWVLLKKLSILKIKFQT